MTAAAATHRLPVYAAEMAAFHRAFARELQAIVASLPLEPSMRLLDVGCGDGFYLGLLAQRLSAAGRIAGFDRNEAYLKVAAELPALQQAACPVDLVCADLARLSEWSEQFDFVWCAQSLFSLPTPVAALEQMSRALKPGGLIAVLENDTLHQLLLPWPSELELELRRAEFKAFRHATDEPDKYYVGRRLPAVFAEAGLAPLSFRTQCIDRTAPLDVDLNTFLEMHLLRLQRRVAPYLAADVATDFRQLIDPGSSHYLLREPHFTMSWLNVLAIGRKAGE